VGDDNAVGNLSASDSDGFQATLYIPQSLTADVSPGTRSMVGLKPPPRGSVPYAPGNSYAEPPLHAAQSTPPAVQGMPALFDRELGLDFLQLAEEGFEREMWSTPTPSTAAHRATAAQVAAHFDSALPWSAQEWQMYGQRLAEQTRLFWSNIRPDTK
jgi:hypothetical protein